MSTSKDAARISFNIEVDEQLLTDAGKSINLKDPEMIVLRLIHNAATKTRAKLGSKSQTRELSPALQAKRDRNMSKPSK